MIKLMKTIFIWVLSMQLGLSQIMASYPDTDRERIGPHVIQKELEDHGAWIKGSESNPCLDENKSQPKMSDEEMDSAIDDLFGGGESSAISYEVSRFDQLIKDMDKKACELGQSEDILLPQASQDQQCQLIKVPGEIEKWTLDILKKEKEKKDIKLVKNGIALVNIAHKRSLILKEKLVHLLRVDEEEKEVLQELILTYIGNVLMPMRDLLIVTKNYDSANRFSLLNDLMIHLPDHLFDEGSDFLTRVSLGPDPANNPFHIRLREDGRYFKMSFQKGAIIQRDILALMRTPTIKNYMQALKWMTLHMMMSQVYFYNNILGQETEIELPKSCKSELNGIGNEAFKFEFRDMGMGNQLNLKDTNPNAYTDKLLADNGLIFNPMDYQFIEYFRDNINKNPMQDGYSGLIPFENQFLADRFMTKKSVALDDITHLEQVLELKMPLAQNSFISTPGVYNNLKKPQMNYGAELWKMMMETPDEYEVYEVQTQNGERRELVPARQNLSLYLTDLMQKKGVLHYTELIDESLKNKLMNTDVDIPLPPLYGSSYWRNWGLKSLAQALTRIKNGSRSTKTIGAKLAKHACKKAFSKSGRQVNSFCRRDSGLKIIQKTIDYLNQYQLLSPNIPTRRIKEADLENRYRFLGILWNSLRDHTEELGPARSNEYDFLIQQMQAYNPWAKMRLSYIIALNELEKTKDGHTPQYQASHSYSGFSLSAESKCYSRNISSILKKFKTAGKEMGLDKVISPFYVQKITSKRQKQSIWQEVIDADKESSMHLFSQNVRGKRVIDHLTNLSQKTLIHKNQINEIVRDNMGKGLDQQSQKAMEQLYTSEAYQYSDFFFKLYKERDIKKQKILLGDFLKEKQLGEEFDVKMNFLHIDNEVKKTMMKQVLREGAYSRKMKIIESLDEFCGLKYNEHEKMKAIFYMTSKAQNHINSLSGLPGVPEHIMEKINSMSTKEWEELWLGLGAGFLGMGAILIGATCTGVTGGLCAPLGVAMMAAGSTAMGMQVTLINREFDNKKLGDDLSRRVQIMEDLGFTSMGSHDEVARSWFWTAFEVISVIPIIGVVSRSLKTGLRLSITSSKVLASNMGKVGFRQAWKLAGQAGKTIVSEADVEMAKYVLRYDNLADQAKSLKSTLGRLGQKQRQAFTEGIGQIKKLRQLRHMRVISPRQMAKEVARIQGKIITLFKGANGAKAVPYTTKVTLDMSFEEINQQTAKVVSRYFNGNPQTLLNLVKSYDKKIAKAAKLYNGQKSLLDKIPGNHRLRKLMGAIRLKDLHKNAGKFREMERELETLVAQGGDLEDFILRNIHDLTDMFIKIPVRKREIPYLVLWQGAPHMAGRRIDGLSQLGDSINMKKFFTARSKLIYETAKVQAKEVLGLAPVIGSKTAFESFRAFELALLNAAEDTSEKGASEIMRQYTQLQEKLSVAIFTNAQNRMMRPGIFGSLKEMVGMGDHRLKDILMNGDRKAFDQILFSPQTLQEEAMGEVLWRATPIEKIFKLDEMGDLAHRVAEELSHYDNIDTFNDYLKALKVLVINRDPGAVEIM